MADTIKRPHAKFQNPSFETMDLYKGLTVVLVDYKVRLGQVKSKFDWNRQKLTRSGRASKLSIFSIKSNSVWR